METNALVLYASPGIGHLISMVELAKFILRHHPYFSITVLISPPPSHNSGNTFVADYIRRISLEVPSIVFHRLPQISLDLDSFPSMDTVLFEIPRRSNDAVLEFLKALSSSATVSAFIIDMFCTAAQGVAAALGIPTYYFLTSGAGALAILLHLTVLNDVYDEGYRDLNEIINVPGVPPFPVSYMPEPTHSRDSIGYRNILECSRNLGASAGILVNTFDALEDRALEALRERKRSNPAPPVFCVGPLTAAAEGDAADGNRDFIINWLNKQPSNSVVYVCFGSLGLLSISQLVELGHGLERSGHRFLWVVRTPPSEDKTKRFLPPPEPDLEAILPEGFTRRTADRGLVVKSWAPQVAVLNHEAVGGFVTHCGWNSVLEAISGGVSMVAWPLYAEQKLKRVMLVEAMKVAVPVEADDHGLVSAAEVERRVNEVM